MAELLFWPVLAAYGEAALAYIREARRPGLPGRLAIWGVRIGWLLQTVLLGVQAVRADGFPWSTRGGALGLFVWLVVGAYLIWGCRPRFRLLGLAVMPPAAILFAVAYAVGGADAGASDRSPLFLALHVGLVLAAFAGFALAAGLAAFYLWEERRLKRRSPRILRFRVPPLASLDRLAARTVVAALALLTLGMLVGFGALDGLRADAATVGTIGSWIAYAALAVMRVRGLAPRRAAAGTLAAFALVVLVLPLAHFA